MRSRATSAREMVLIAQRILARSTPFSCVPRLKWSRERVWREQKTSIYFFNCFPAHLSSPRISLSTSATVLLLLVAFLLLLRWSSVRLIFNFSDYFEIPAVSIRVISCFDRQSTRLSTGSWVVPAIGLTIALSSPLNKEKTKHQRAKKQCCWFLPSKRLRREDFPTFGLPTIAIRMLLAFPAFFPVFASLAASTAVAKVFTFRFFFSSSSFAPALLISSFGASPLFSSSSFAIELSRSAIWSNTSAVPIPCAALIAKGSPRP